MKRHQPHEIRSFIMRSVKEHPRDVTMIAAEHFGLTRQAILRHVRQLLRLGILEATGRTRNISYAPKKIAGESRPFPIGPDTTEDRVWREFVARVMASAPENLVRIPRNVLDICQYGFSEIFNNALEHSEGTGVVVEVEVTACSVFMSVYDNGVGIFAKIMKSLGLEDHRHAILELTKGKLTTDPEGHTGEGIFFTSRMFDEFSICSGELFFSHTEPEDDWLIEARSSVKGTLVTMQVSVEASRTSKQVFDAYAMGGDGYTFAKTHVPVELLRYGQENLVSRSQARRLLARFERFEEVMLDFTGVPMIGQAFGDEVFRVFHRQNPQVKLIWINATPEVERMILRAMSAYERDSAGGAPSPDSTAGGSPSS